MTHRLYLLRHAKSSRGDPGLADHERPLAPRGERATAALRAHFREAGVGVELVLCSSAVRAVQTLEGVRDGLPAEAGVETDDALYEAGATGLLDRLRALAEETGSVMLIGHNPAIEELAHELTGGGDADARARMKAKYPTGGLAGFRLECPWRDLGPGDAILESFVVPKDLG